MSTTSSSISFTFLLRRGTAAEWSQVNPVLSAGEPGIETDTGGFKFGDGTRPWAELPHSGWDVAGLMATVRTQVGSDITAALVPVSGRITTVEGTLADKVSTGTLTALTTTLRGEMTAARTAAETRAGQLDAALATTLRSEIATNSTATRSAAESRAVALDSSLAATLRGEYTKGLRVPNVGIDEDGVPYYAPGATGGQILLDPADGNPYYVVTG